MIKEIPNSFSGVLSLPGGKPGHWDAFFNVQDSLVTIIPATEESKQCVSILSSHNGSDEKNNWLYGRSEDGCRVAFLQKTRLVESKYSPDDTRAAKFSAPIIVKSSVANDTDLRTFNIIEFRGGIVDVLYNPDLVIDKISGDDGIQFRDFSSFAKTYEVEIEKDKFEITYSISTADLRLETGKIPDLRKGIHSIVRFDFATDRPLGDIGKYYFYALNLFQFCTGRLNVNFDIRLYKKRRSETQNVVIPSPILVKLRDGFDDYANETLDITKVIRFQFLGDKLPSLLKILNEEDTQPCLEFLIKRNKNIGNILYTDIGDICASFEREHPFIKAESNEENQKYAKELTDKLLAVVNEKDAKGDSVWPEAVKKKANDILSAQLKRFSPSLKEKIGALYDEFEPNLRSITEPKTHVELGVIKSYSNEEFKQKISRFVNIRHKAAHGGIEWNDGVEIFVHLKLLVYFCIMKRAGYSVEESTHALSWLFGWYF